MASALLALLSQQSPNLQTRRALILCDLQKDFLSPSGHLTVSNAPQFLARVRQLVPAFRGYGDIIWVRSQIEEAGEGVTAGHSAKGIEFDEDTRESGPETETDIDIDVPTKKAKTSTGSKATTDRLRNLPDRTKSEHSGSKGRRGAEQESLATRAAKKQSVRAEEHRRAEYADQIKDLFDSQQDLHITKTELSAFESTSLLITLRSKLITEIYIAGCLTDVSVYATAMDAARYGIKITLVEDCLGHRKKERHDLALTKLRDVIEAKVMTGEAVLKRLQDPAMSDSEDDREEEEEEQEAAEEEDEEEGDDEDEEDKGRKEDGGAKKYERPSILPGGRPPEQIAADVLEADSEEDEDEDEDEEPSPPNVGSLRISNPTMVLRYASARSASSRLRAVTKSNSSAPTQHSQPPKIEPAHANDSRITGSRPGPQGSRSGNTQSHTETVRGCSSRSSVGRGSTDSPSRQAIQQPWDDFIRAKKSSASGYSGRRAVHPGLAGLASMTNLDPKTVDEFQVMMDRARGKDNQPHQNQPHQGRPLFGEGKESESAGSRILYDLLEEEVAETIFNDLQGEIEWQTMTHQTGEVPRLVCCQGTIGEDKSMPVYRHPSDQTLPIRPWTQAVDRVRKVAEEAVGHPLNHGLIQLYRSGTDYISEHSDKTLDITRGTQIVNVSFGAQRTMRLRTKRGASQPSCSAASPPRTAYRIPMPHNSMITMSLPTNAQYLHGINADKRPIVELSAAEKAFEGQRISLTFRNIGTFLNEDSSRIWGQGAVAATQEKARPVMNGDSGESARLVKAFGSENQSSAFEWDAIYGDGFDVLHLKV